MRSANRTALSGIPDLLPPHYDDPRRDHIYQNYTLRAKQGSEFSDYLKANGVEVLTQFRKPYYRHEALKLEDRGFPETEALSREVCSLPMNVEITDDEVDYVISVVRSFYRKQDQPQTHTDGHGQEIVEIVKAYVKL